MKRLPCPHCGKRDEIEFTFGGPADLVRPALDCSDEQWRDYLFTRINPRGAHRERWCHTYGCGQWFEVTRDTVTNVILSEAHVILSEAKDQILRSAQNDGGGA